jgi:hypothetical protein
MMIRECVAEFLLVWEIRSDVLTFKMEVHFWTQVATLNDNINQPFIMRSSFSRTAKQLSLYANRLSVQSCRVSGARWSSTEGGGHKYSTPLAKQLAEVITVLEYNGVLIRRAGR